MAVGAWAGEESGRKARPALIVVAVTQPETGKVHVALAPLTSQAPGGERSAVEIPRSVRMHLGLDAGRSWVICDEYNEFDWPGVYLGALPNGESAFGFVPDALLERVREEMALVEGDEINVFEVVNRTIIVEKDRRRQQALDNMRARSWPAPADHTLDRDEANER